MENKSKYWKFIIGFLIIMILVGGGFFVWEKYLSPQAKINRETQKNYQKYLDWQANYEKAMKEDTYGGKTPEETLQMFIEALRKDDIELASKYFIIGTDGNLKKDLIEGLKKAKEEDRITFIIDITNKSKFDLIHSDKETAWFTVNNEKGISEYSIILKLNKYSSVWKIESL